MGSRGITKFLIKLIVKKARREMSSSAFSVLSACQSSSFKLKHLKTGYSKLLRSVPVLSGGPADAVEVRRAGA